MFRQVECTPPKKCEVNLFHWHSSLWKPRFNSGVMAFAAHFILYEIRIVTQCHCRSVGYEVKCDAVLVVDDFNWYLNRCVKLQLHCFKGHKGTIRKKSGHIIASVVSKLTGHQLVTAKFCHCQHKFCNLLG